MSSVLVQELRGHMVRRLPTPAELVTRSPIALTERDRQLLEAVHLHGFLTADLVELAFFAPVCKRRSSRSSSAYERLRDLWLWGYLERVELPVARVLGGRRPFLYALGRQGLALVESSAGTAARPVQLRRLDRLDHVFVDHDLKAAALWANVTAQVRSRGGCRFGWIGERDLRARRMRVRSHHLDRWLPFLPDGYFEVVYPSGDVQAYIVEIDMGTLTLRRFARKLEAFETALVDGVFRRHFKADDFEVLVLTHSRRRLESLRQVALRVVESDRRDAYRLATFQALVPRSFCSARWLDLDGDSTTGVLHR
jgi:hypothetical protein